MSSAVQTVGSTQLVRLGSPLIVAIRLQGTIGLVSALSSSRVHARPYTRYLARTLQQLRCDVTLIAPTNEQFDSAVIQQFAANEFTVPFRLLHDVSPTARGSQLKKTVSSRNYTQYLNAVAEQHNAQPDRVLFIDSEINYRYTPVQTLVLEPFEPHTRRQMRQRRVSREAENAAASFGSAAPQGEPRADTTAAQRRAMSYRQRMQSSMQSVQESTETLAAEAAYAHSEPGRSIEDEDADEDEDEKKRRAASQWLGRKDSQRTRVTVANPQGSAGSTSTSTSTNTNTNTNTSSSTSTSCSAVSINPEDFTLIALADIVAQLAASDVSVSAYLATEPLVEKLRVPFHGLAHYLPMENCDHIDTIDWESVRVEEQEAHDPAVPDVEETAEHKDFFK